MDPRKIKGIVLIVVMVLIPRIVLALKGFLLVLLMLPGLSGLLGAAPVPKGT